MRKGLGMYRGMDALPIALEVAQIAAAPASTAERAVALLDPLHRVLPFDGVWLALREEERRGHRSLISRGWDRRVASFLDGPTVVDEIEQLDMGRSTKALRVADLPTPPGELLSWAEYMLPAGFHEGVGVSLFTRDGRCVGFLGMLTGDRATPSDDVRDLVLSLAPILSYTIDPLRSLAAAARLVHGATAGVLLTRSGDVVPVPGLPGHEMLQSGSPVVMAATRLSEGVHTSFLVPYPVASQGYLRITILAVPADASHFFTAVLTVSNSGDLNGLTRRELEILGLMIDGWPNGRIARSLLIAERTVASHVEHILAKLKARSRALAAVRAQRNGWYIPGPLAKVPDPSSDSTP
jgi:DNA-binding CsgD family transcriptional regulator